MRLTLFLTQSLTLRKWYEQGIFDREIAIYRKLQEMGVTIQIVSYGGRDEQDFASRLPDMRILTNWLNWSPKRYENRLHQLHGLHLWRTDLIKTNQMIGADIVLRASRAWRKPLLLRMGYMWSYNAQRANPDKPTYLKNVDRIERDAFDHATKIIVTTDDIRTLILEKSPDVQDKITVLPNYVDTDTFRPMDESKTYDLIYVGRLAKEKNLDALLQAVDRAGVSIAMIGDGDQKDHLQATFGDLDGRIHWLGRIPNTELPTYINRARAYVLCSFYEGHPKALIEAMGCGVPVLGTTIRGIQQVITHGDNGYLCGLTADELQAGIQDLLGQPDLTAQLGKRGHDFVESHYSLDTIAQTEYNLYKAVIQNHKGR